MNVVELRQIVKEEIKQYKPIDTPEELADIFRELIADHDREVFSIMCFNAKMVPTLFHIVSQGTLTESMVHPREVFKVAILNNANGVVFAHNHPSGDRQPSHADERVYRNLKEAANLLGIQVIDNFIITRDSYYSFEENSRY
jgi:DNA repair protein RadC